MCPTSFLVVKNRAYSKLAAAITAGATTLTVTSGEGANFPSTYPFHLTIDDEVVSCTARSTDSLTIVRAQQGTSGATHANKAYVALNITAKSITDLNTAVNDIENDVVYKSLFDAHTILYAVSDDTPVALTVGEQTLVGRLTSGNISAVAIGIADNNILQIDHASVADNDYAKFTATGVEGRSYQELVNDISGVIKATDVEVSELSTATYDDVQDYINFFGDRTILSGGTITDNGDGTAAIASLTGWCKETDSDTAIGRFFDYGGGNTPALTDMTRNYIYIDYNGGTPQIVASTSLLTHGLKFDYILIGTIFRNGTILHWHQHHNIGIERANVIDLYELEEHAASRVDGMVTSDAGSRAISLTSGVLYEGIDREPTSPFDTPNSGAADATEANKLHDADGGFASTDVGKSIHNTTDDTYAIVTAFVNSGELTLDADIFISGENYDLDIFSYWHTSDSGSTWTEVKGSTLISNSQYNDITAGLASLTSNRYGVHWVYMDLDGSNLHIVYGQGDYTVNQAEEARVPSVLPPNVSEYGLLIAKIILQEGQTAMTIALPWTTVFTSTLATDHGSLGGLSDDDHTQYVLHTEVDDSPVNGVTADPISSNWAFDHVAAADPHTGYRLESADHSHQTTGAQAGKIDHGAALDGLGDDDHTQYMLNSVAGANSMLYSVSDNTPAALAVAASRIVGRKSSGDIAALTGAETLAILSGQAGAAFSFNSQNLTSVGTLNAHTIPGGTDTFAMLAATQELDNKTLDSAVAKGTWTSLSWGIPAGTLQGTLTLNGQVFDAGSGNAEINTTGTEKGLIIKSTNVSSPGAKLDLEHVSSSPDTLDYIGYLRWIGRDSGANSTAYSYIGCRIENPADGSEEASLRFYLQNTGINLVMYLSGAGELFVDVDSGGGFHVGSVDHLDDAKMLYAFSHGQIDTLIQEGIVEVTEQEGRIDRMISLNRMNVALAGGIYQTRSLIEAIARRLGISMESLIEEVKQIPGSGWQALPIGEN